MMNTNKRRSSVEIVDSPPDSQEDLASSSYEMDFTTLTKENVAKLFEGRNLAFISTLSKDGSPHVTPVWADIDEDIIQVNTSEASAKSKHVSRDPRVAISVVEQYNPYNMVSIMGKVIEQTTVGADQHLHKLAKKYLGIGKYYYRTPKDKRILLKIKPEKIMGLTLHPAFYFLAYSP
jgi:PPOX class probable F420-dependent enzyme